MKKRIVLAGAALIFAAAVGYWVLTYFGPNTAPSSAQEEEPLGIG